MHIVVVVVFKLYTASRRRYKPTDHERRPANSTGEDEHGGQSTKGQKQDGAPGPFGKGWAKGKPPQGKNLRHLASHISTISAPCTKVPLLDLVPFESRTRTQIAATSGMHPDWSTHARPA